tara:strand:+ start:503 stop:1534 length:1032 start_codon:yes stop_codon:yes gene_type:complete
MAVTEWKKNRLRSVGDIRRPTTDEGTGLHFRCTTTGTTGSTEPTWPNSIGDTVTDGDCVWTAISATYSDLTLSNPSAIIELFQVRLSAELHGSNDIYYFHAGINDFGDTDIVFADQAYARIPVKAEGFEYTNTGTLPRPTLTISNLGSGMTSLLLLANQTTAGNDLGGAEVRRIRTLKKYLDRTNFREEGPALNNQGTDNFLVAQNGDSLIYKRSIDNPTADPNARFPDERWFIDRKASETRDAITFELASKFDLAGQKLPRRQIIANICQWQYKKDGCNYKPGDEAGKVVNGVTYHRFDANDNPVTSDNDDVCGKRVSSCECRFGKKVGLPFGSFPAAGLSK